MVRQRIRAIGWAGLAWLAGGAVAAPGTELASQRYVAIRGTSGEIDLEGPGVNGPDGSAEKGVDGAGVQFEGNWPLGDRVFARVWFDWTEYDRDLSFQQASAGIGYRRPLVRREGWGLSGYGIVAGEYARSDGVDSFQDDPVFAGRGTGESGDDFGFSAEGGAGVTWGQRWEGVLYAKYLTFGDGDGPGFGARLHYAVRPDWTVLAGWDGLWVEDAGYQIDLTPTRFTLGVARRF